VVINFHRQAEKQPEYLRLPTIWVESDLQQSDLATIPRRVDEQRGAFPWQLLHPVPDQVSTKLMVNPLLQALPVADMPKAQLLMVAGFVMLAWVLARRQIRMQRRANQEARAADKALQSIRQGRIPAVPLSDAPKETQRWQVAMFDLQRELKAELDTRIAIVQTLLRQVDERIARLSSLESEHQATSADPPPQPDAAPPNRGK
jgi:hypothetical protein